MDLKKKLKRFFTLTRKANDGFTLVELIVVIAILAILAGVGSVGYAGYIKAANKGNDKVLVGEVMRAIEMGTYSTMFTNNDSFKMGKISYPVGFVTLTTEGAQVVASQTTMTEAATDKACEWVTIENATVITQVPGSWTCEKNGTSGSDNSNRYPAYSIITSDVTYCATHTTPEMLSAGLRTIGSNPEEYTTGYICTKTTNHSSSHNWRNNPVKTSVSNTTIVNPSSLYQQSSDASICEYAYANQNATFTGTTSIEPATTGNALYDSLTAAFGDVSTLKLTYDGWASDGDINYASFYISAPQLMEDIEALSGLLATASKLDGTTIPIINYTVNLGIDGTYDSGEEVLGGVANNIISAHQNETSWMEAWNNAGDEAFTNPSGFGVGGRENYSAVRMAYNNAFASYLIANGIEEQYANAVKNFYTQSINVPTLGTLGNPGVVNTDAFANSDVLKNAFVNAGDTNAGEEGSVFNQCAALYETYKNSSACAENGKLVYDTMSTFKDTADIATDSKNAYGGNMFDYYNSYVNEISALYTAAQTAAGDGGVVIIVSVEDGLVNCNVSPAEANPRLD